MKQGKLIHFLLMMVLFACGKEEFAANKQIQTSNTPAQKQVSSFQCAQHTLIRPPVDLLFLWDNSTSTVFINDRTKSALNNIINSVSDRFDYNIMMAPLIGSGNSNSFFFSRSGHNPGSGITTINPSFATTALSQFPIQQGSAESGAQRAIDLINSNQSNGVFRQNAYHLVVVMSNEDSTSFNPPGANFEIPAYKTDYMNGKAHDLLCLRGNYNGSMHNSRSSFGSNCSGASSLNSLMTRFITIAALNNTTCSQSSLGHYRINSVYRGISERVYGTAYTNGTTPPSDQLGPYIDATDICLEQYDNIFDGVNTAITDTVIKHVYKYWPITSPSGLVDASTLVVTRNDGTQFNELASHIVVTEDNTGKNDKDQFNNTINGWRMLPGNNTVNTRFLPSAGEPFSGKVIQLFGQAKVSFPFCLRIDYKEPREFFRYVHMNSKPLESSIVLKINGQVIPKGGSNGWSLVGSNGEATFLSNFNIKVKSPSDLSPGSPGVFKTGYFVQVSGNAIYSNGDSIEISFLPKGN